MNQQANERLNEQISAYVDGALSGRELADFEAALAGDAELARNVAATRALVRAAGELPPARLPRSFTLPLNTQPAQSFWEKLFGLAAPPQKILRLGSAAAGLLCVFFLGMGLLNAKSPIFPAVRDAPAVSGAISMAQAPAAVSPTAPPQPPPMMSAMKEPSAPRSAPPAGGGLGGGPSSGALGGGGEPQMESADVVPTNPPLPANTPTPKPTPVVTVPQAHITSLSWAWVAAAVVSLAAAIALGALGWRKTRF